MRLRSIFGRPTVTGAKLMLAATLVCPSTIWAQEAAESGGTAVRTGISSGARTYTEGLEGVDLTGLTQEQKTLALKVLNQADCTCGCNMTVAQCRVEDQSCPRSPLQAGPPRQSVPPGPGTPCVFWKSISSGSFRGRRRNRPAVTAIK